MSDTDWKTVVVDPISGIEHSIRLTNDGDLQYKATDYNVQALLEQNKTQYNMNDGYTPSREMRRVATIPDIVALKWLNEEGWWYLDADCKHKLIEKLNSNEWQYLRTAPGRIGIVGGKMM